MRPINKSSWGGGEGKFRIWQHPYIIRVMCLLLVMLSARVFHEHAPEIRATDWERQMLFAPSRQSPQDNQGYREDRPKNLKPLELREGLNKPTGSEREQSDTNAASYMSTRAPGVRGAPLLIITHDRADYLDRALTAISRHYPGNRSAPIVISEDGNHLSIANTIRTHREALLAKYPDQVFLHINHNQVRILDPKQDPSAPTGYHKLSQHYKWALSQVFDHLTELDARAASVDKVIILEEDLEVAPDFFDYFDALAPLLDGDQTLMAISAFNDNGMADRVRDPTALFRSDFFPGLGWMMPRRLWEEVEPKWPEAYWDDWLREPAQRKERQVIRPEICRTFHFATRGTSNNQFSNHLEAIQLNDHRVDFKAMNVELTLDPQIYSRSFMQSVNDARLVSYKELMSDDIGEGTVKIVYSSLSTDPNSFESLARYLGLMVDSKSGVHRTAYRGIVTCWRSRTKVHLIPEVYDEPGAWVGAKE